MQVFHFQLIELFQELGYADAGEWKPGRMYAMIYQLHGIMANLPPDFLIDSLTKVSKSLIQAHEQNARIEIYDGPKRIATNDEKHTKEKSKATYTPPKSRRSSRG